MKALDGLDATLEHRVRLAVGVLLARHGEISFAAFKQKLALTAAIWHNDHIGAPTPRSLIAYDH